LALVLGALTFLSGCDGISNEPYPEAMKYPQRADLLVLKEPKNTVLFPYAEPPGHMEETIAKVAGLEDGKVADPKTLAPKDHADLGKFLQDAFGTPAKPTVKIDDDDAMTMVKALQLDDASLAAGSQLYRRHCLQCHGVTGDGRGPTGPWLHPHPRDYRQGVFKFVSSEGGGRKPRRDDLFRTLTVGIEGTSMPSFALLSETERQHIISYVIHLSLRGEVEYYIAAKALGGNIEDSIGEDSQTWTKTLLQRWQKSNKSQMEPTKSGPPANREESVVRGYERFTDSKGGNCVSCHFDFGRQAQFRYDKWGTLVRPNNLTMGVYRGGRRPIDLYWRLRGGIEPCAMPEMNKPDDEDKIWDLVNFVQALPYPERLPKDVRDKVYPAQAEKKLAER
jgi:mono/diheme cytochrome c family protein